MKELLATDRSGHTRIDPVRLQTTIAFIRLLLAGALAGLAVSGAASWVAGFPQSHIWHFVGVAVGVVIAASYMYKTPHAI